MSEATNQSATKAPDARTGQVYVRLDCSDPTGREVNAVLAPSIKTWVRCMWPDLVSMKLGPAPDYAILLKNCQIVPPHKVYELRGRVGKRIKQYGDVPEFRIYVEEATDITLQAQMALQSAKAYFDLSKGVWPIDDEF